MTFPNRLPVHLALAYLLTLGIGSCSPASGFRFRGEYEAPRSGLRVHVLSQGTLKFGSDLSESAYALVQFCPLKRSGGNPVLASFRTTPGSWIQMECADPPVPLSEWNARTSDELLAELLGRAGYGGLGAEEVRAVARAISGAVAGPKGVVLEGQTRELRVVHTEIVHGWRFGRDRPQEQWIRPSELPGCGSHKKHAQQRA